MSTVANSGADPTVGLAVYGKGLVPKGERESLRYIGSRSVPFVLWEVLR